MDSAPRSRAASKAAVGALATGLLVAALAALPSVARARYEGEGRVVALSAGGRVPVSGPLAGRRALLIGDSLLYQAIPPLRARLEAEGVEVHDRAVPGSGLLAAPLGFVQNWLADATRLVDQIRPDVVVAQFVGNYGPPYARNGQGRDVAPHSAEFLDLWSATSEDLARRLTAHGATLLWVVPPPLRSAFEPAMNSTVDAVARRYQAMAALPGVRLVDWAGPLGGRPYVDSVEGVVLRQPDGIHLSEEGLRRVADVTATAVIETLGAPD